eukprot:6204055-Pleurochrysis_carterae.AAC.1
MSEARKRILPCAVKLSLPDGVLICVCLRGSVCLSCVCADAEAARARKSQVLPPSQRKLICDAMPTTTAQASPCLSPCACPCSCS